ncbi:unnamed protein product [Owenia fusiformis]|uniref:Cholesterol side-chain cleavage enzyme, mitochondrial n=1 Tax=Owenia fusiformis TaxID=6347 RepID=A0A8J1XT73_OWEFU|nr:unnamed protein product [Owenia fusiformis]
MPSYCIPLANRGLCRFSTSPCCTTFLSPSNQNVVSKSQRSTSATSALSEDTHEHVKPFKDIPGHTGFFERWKNLYLALKGQNEVRISNLLYKDYNVYGSIYKQYVGPIAMVSVGGPEVIEQLFRNLDKYPLKPLDTLGGWIAYREIRGEACGVLTAEEQNWADMRNVLSKKILKPKHIQIYGPKINSIVSDMVTRLRYARDVDGNGLVIPQLTNELYKWSMEGVCSILYETRLGCLDNKISPDLQAFIDAVANMLTTTGQLNAALALQIKLNSKPWRVHRDAWDTIFGQAKKCIDNRRKELADKLQNEETDPDDEGAELLTYLFANNKMSDKEIHANMTELMMAGVDTTSNTLGFALYLLAQHPEAQDKLKTEVDQVLNGRLAEYSDFQNMPYLRAVVKETLRIYPVVPIYARIVDKDFVLGGYKIPKRTFLLLNHMGCCRDEKVFKNADQFIPERWYRKEGRADHHAFASVPFSYGVRSCVGRRIAELELYLALCRISNEFKLKLSDGEFVPFYRGILTPGREVPIEFHDR